MKSISISQLLKEPTNEILDLYRSKIIHHTKSGTASEETYYGDFIRLLEEIFPIKNKFLVQANPKDEDDKPDFIISYKYIPILRIEGKTPGSPIEDWVKPAVGNRLHNQIYRYRGGENGDLPVAITDFVCIYSVLQGSPNKEKMKHELSKPVKILEERNNNLILNSLASKELLTLFQVLTINVSGLIEKLDNLIDTLVIPAKAFRDQLLEILSLQKISRNEDRYLRDYLDNIMEDFNKLLYDEKIEKKEFAGLLGETIVYGLFVAWMRFCREGFDPKNFSIAIAGEYLPYGSFIRQIFMDVKQIFSSNFIKKHISPIENTFQRIHFPSIIADVEHLMTAFYSIFLWKYDPETAKRRGVINTPHEIVDFIIKGVDYLLKKYFNKEKGVFSSNVTFLDPACGIMTFPSRLIHYINRNISKEYSQQKSRIPIVLNEWYNHVFLKNVFAFEVLIAPYALGHMRIGITTKELGIENQQTDNVKLFLINTLMNDPPEFSKFAKKQPKTWKKKFDPGQTSLDWYFKNQAIAKEARAALNVRNEESVLVILGNPPYSVSSQNKSEWIENKMQSYKEGLIEKNIQPLSDDYIKFIRFAQWKIEKSNCGIVAFITNNTYLDSRIFKVMRKELCRSFDHIFIVNLHGNARKGEQGNPFDIMVGVSIVFFVRDPSHSEEECSLYYWDIPHPTRAEKYLKLAKEFNESNFKELPITDEKFFTPIKIEQDLQKRYNSFISIDQLFHLFNVGITTHRDSFVIDIDTEVLKEKLILFTNKEDFELKKINVQLKETDEFPKTKLQNKDYLDEYLANINSISYRGFDKRYICYDERLLDRARKDLMQHIDNDNIVLCTTKILLKTPFNHVFVTDSYFDKCFLSTNSKESTYGFPLKTNNKSNIKMPSLSFSATDESIFFYIYSILHSKTYREKYEELLAKDFPKIPFTNNKRLFFDMVDLGKKLVDLHLLRSPDLNPRIFKLSKDVDLKILDIIYDEKHQRIYLQKPNKGKTNSITWIGDITSEMWEFTIGNKKQLRNWLYHRRYSPTNKKNYIKRSITNDEFDNFLTICDSIKKTIALIPKIDELYHLVDP